MAFGSHVQGYASVTSATMSVTLVAAQSGADGSRIHFCKGFISVWTATTTGVLTLMETDSTASDSAVILTIPGACVKGYPIDMGEHGYILSTSSRLIMNLTGGSVSAAAMVTGYVR